MVLSEQTVEKIKKDRAENIFLKLAANSTKDKTKKVLLEDTNNLTDKLKEKLKKLRSEK